MNTNLSAGCPTGVTIIPSTGTFEAGDVLTCSADGYDRTYTWTGIAAVNGATISETGVDYTLQEGPFYVICTATVSQLSCHDSATVSNTAYSKYQYPSNYIDEKQSVLSDVCISSQCKWQNSFYSHKCCTLLIISSFVANKSD